jgi:hypothetical protein
MMIGTFFGWQVHRLVLLHPRGAIRQHHPVRTRRDDVIAYGPHLCLAAAVTVILPRCGTGPADFRHGWLVPAVLVVCLACWAILAIWQLIKTASWPRRDDSLRA